MVTAMTRACHQTDAISIAGLPTNTRRGRLTTIRRAVDVCLNYSVGPLHTPRRAARVIHNASPLSNIDWSMQPETPSCQDVT